METGRQPPTPPHRRRPRGGAAGGPSPRTVSPRRRADKNADRRGDWQRLFPANFGSKFHGGVDRSNESPRVVARRGGMTGKNVERASAEALSVMTPWDQEEENVRTTTTAMRDSRRGGRGRARQRSQSMVLEGSVVGGGGRMGSRWRSVERGAMTNGDNNIQHRIQQKQALVNALELELADLEGNRNPFGHAREELTENKLRRAGKSARQKGGTSSHQQKEQEEFFAPFVPDDDDDDDEESYFDYEDDEDVDNRQTWQDGGPFPEYASIPKPRLPLTGTFVPDAIVPTVVTPGAKCTHPIVQQRLVQPLQNYARMERSPPPGHMLHFTDANLVRTRTVASSPFRNSHTVVGSRQTLSRSARRSANPSAPQRDDQQQPLSLSAPHLRKQRRSSPSNPLLPPPSISIFHTPVTTPSASGGRVRLPTFYSAANSPAAATPATVQMGMSNGLGGDTRASTARNRQRRVAAARSTDDAAAVDRGIASDKIRGLPPTATASSGGGQRRLPMGGPPMAYHQAAASPVVVAPPVSVVGRTAATRGGGVMNLPQPFLRASPIVDVNPQADNFNFYSRPYERQHFIQSANLPLNGDAIRFLPMYPSPSFVSSPQSLSGVNYRHAQSETRVDTSNNSVKPSATTSAAGTALPAVHRLPEPRAVPQPPRRGVTNFNHSQFGDLPPPRDYSAASLTSERNRNESPSPKKQLTWNEFHHHTSSAADAPGRDTRGSTHDAAAVTNADPTRHFSSVIPPRGILRSPTRDGIPQTAGSIAQMHGGTGPEMSSRMSTSRPFERHVGGVLTTTSVSVRPLAHHYRDGGSDLQRFVYEDRSGGKWGPMVHDTSPSISVPLAERQESINQHLHHRRREGGGDDDHDDDDDHHRRRYSESVGSFNRLPYDDRARMRSDDEGSRRRALCVGISYRGSANREKLDGAVQDAFRWQTKLKDSFGFSDVRVLTDCNRNGTPVDLKSQLPTKANVLRSLEELCRGSVAGDILFLSISCLGVRVNYHSAAEAFAESALLPSDFLSPSDDSEKLKLVYSDEIHEVIARHVSDGVQMVVILDTSSASTIVPLGLSLTKSKTDGEMHVSRKAGRLDLASSVLGVRAKALGAAWETTSREFPPIKIVKRRSRFLGFEANPLEPQSLEHATSLGGEDNPSRISRLGRAIFCFCASSEGEQASEMVIGPHRAACGLLTLCMMEALELLATRASDNPQPSILDVFKQAVFVHNNSPKLSRLENQTFVLRFSEKVPPHDVSFLSHDPPSLIESPPWLVALVSHSGRAASLNHADDATTFGSPRIKVYLSCLRNLLAAVVHPSLQQQYSSAAGIATGQTPSKNTRRRYFVTLSLTAGTVDDKERERDEDIPTTRGGGGGGRQSRTPVGNSVDAQSSTRMSSPEDLLPGANGGSHFVDFGESLVLRWRVPQVQRELFVRVWEDDPWHVTPVGETSLLISDRRTHELMPWTLRSPEGKLLGLIELRVDVCPRLETTTAPS